MCDAKSKFQMMLQLNCDLYAEKTTYSLDTASLVDPCRPRVILSSKEACPKLSLGTLWSFFNKNYHFFGLFMMVLGIFLMIVGGRYYKFTMFMAG